MMKTKALYLYLLIIVASLGFTSCLEDGGNSQTVSYTPAVVKYSLTSGTSIVTDYGIFATPSLDLKYSSGDCLLAAFTLDYDNQPSNTYVTATNVIVGEDVSNTHLFTMLGDMSQDNFKDSMSLVNDISSCLNGMIFYTVRQSATVDDRIEYKLLWNTDSIDKNGIQSFYLKSNIIHPTPASTKPINSNHFTVYAFNVANAMATGRDTTINGYSGKYKYIKYNLNYQSGTNAQGKPKYSAYEKNPITLFMAIDQ